VIAAAGLPAGDFIPLHLVALASLRGLAVRGPMIGAQHAYVLTRDWLGTPPPALDQDVALAELTRRYLAGHGPAADRDLAKWAGIPLGQARRGLTAIAAELADRPDGLAELAAGPAGEAGPGGGGPDGGGPGGGDPGGGGLDGGGLDGGGLDDRRLPGPRLLGAFDPVLLGWASREPILGEHQGIVTVNGLFRPFALVAGRAAGIWSYAGGQVKLDPFADLPAVAHAALAAEARDVQRFLAPLPEDTGPENTGPDEMGLDDEPETGSADDESA
jgi:hypothetical protein